MRVTVQSPDGKSARELQACLQEAGVEARASVAGARGGPTDVVVMDLRTGPPAEAVCAPVLAKVGLAPFAAPPTTIETVDAIVPMDAHPDLIGRELKEAFRAGLARAELQRRIRTAGELGVAWPRAKPKGGLRTLYVGEPHRLFLALETAHARRGARIDAVFTSFLGFDVLHDQQIDGIVLNATRDPGTAISLCGAMRRNARLHHVAALVIIEEGDRPTEDAAASRGASIVASGAIDDAALSTWLFHKLATCRARTGVNAELEASRVSDGPMMEADFFPRHLANLTADAHATLLPVSMAALKLEPATRGRRPGSQAWTDACHALADLAQRLVRSYDIPAMLDDGLILIAFPGLAKAEAQTAADRIAAVAECTTFAASEEAAPASYVVQHHVAELAPGESGGALMRRTLDPFLETRAGFRSEA